jgi:hypothetical protein
MSSSSGNSNDFNAWKLRLLNSVSCGFSSLNNKYLFGLLKVYDNKCGADDIQNILSRSE